jgi:hypothetical protein
MLFKELHIPLPSLPIIWCDNVGALALNPVYHAQIKHIEVDYHFIHEKVLNKDIVPKYISTVNQVANVFTKGLSAIHFSQLCTKLHVHHLLLRLRGLLSKILCMMQQILKHTQPQQSRIQMYRLDFICI